MLSLRLAAAIALTVALLLALGPRVAKAEKLESFEVAGWVGGAYAEDDGRFSHCSLGATYNSDITLVFLMDDAGLYLMLGKPGWRLPLGEQYQLTLRVDQSWQRQLPGLVTGEAELTIPIGDDADALRSLKQGRFLGMDARHESFGFKLEGTMKALSLLERCVERRLYAGSLNPFGGPGEGPGEGTANPFGPVAPGAPEAPLDPDDWTYRDFALTPQKLKEFLVAASGGGSARVHRPGANDAYLDFVVEGIPGTYLEFPTDMREPDATLTFRLLAEAFADDCRARVGSGTLDATLVGGLDIVRGFHACSSPDRYVAVIALSESYLDSLLTMEASREGQAVAERLGRRFFSTLAAAAGSSYEGVSLLFE
ncbi:hypothetical protein [Algihabitans albus]|uniref:hypothetical protein n=1 Tax=Algihabitans albus TaxID=2164067 RepID=UPI000E5D72C9|nr:hypothetical protein [Algihabitans albus]